MLHIDLRPTNTGPQIILRNNLDVIQDILRENVPPLVGCKPEEIILFLSAPTVSATPPVHLIVEVSTGIDDLEACMQAVSQSWMGIVNAPEWEQLKLYASPRSTIFKVCSCIMYRPES